MVLQRIVGIAPVFNSKYLDFSRHWGFDISPCNVAKGNEKARIYEVLAAIALINL